MIYFTAYANQKFDILQKHKVYVIKEQIQDAIKSPDKVSKKGKYFSATKDEWRVIYQKQAEVIRVLTFYPVKV
ncbi:hypothetical protein HGA34_01930 [Candidatus Falkowbacteria bacterium]|nr:hypothetical protein [Candidatus Falkowbacteria bacterium]